MYSPRTNFKGFARILGAMLSVLAPAGAIGQTFTLEPIAAGSTDEDPLRASITNQRADLLVPENFERVYRVRSNVNLFGHSREMYARVSNGLIAIFPRSSYVSSRQGLTTVIPPDTTWFIGTPTIVRAGAALPVSLSRESELEMGMVLPLDFRIDNTIRSPSLSAKAVSTAPPEETPKAQRNIWINESYRQQRIGARLDEAGARARR